MSNNQIKEQFNQYRLSWINSSKMGISVDENFKPIPWYSFQAIEYLNSKLKKTDIIFEFGCGSSTLYFQSRVKKIISLETNENWFNIITTKIANEKKLLASKNLFKKDNVEIYLLKDGLENCEYENFAHNYSLKHQIKFDYIIIDSIKRQKSTINSINALSNNGTIILDDAERKHYQKIYEFLISKNFNRESFLGIAPAQLKIKNTDFFTKKNS